MLTKCGTPRGEGGFVPLLKSKKMEKDKLLKEYMALKINDAHKLFGGQQPTKITELVYWVKTNGSTGQLGDWQMDKKIDYCPDPDFSPTPSDTIPQDTIPSH